MPSPLSHGEERHSSAAQPSFGRVGSLDGIRAIAVVLVMLSHIGLGRLFPGQFGVTLFFFLSGYLITSLLRVEVAQHGSVSFRNFYLRRTFRIIPPLAITITFAAVLSGIGLLQPYDGRSLLIDAAFLTNYLGSASVLPLWSLDVEEHYYLIFAPLFAVLLRTRGPAATALFCASLCAVFLAIRIAEAMSATTLGAIKAINFFSHTRMDSILYGAILALWRNPRLDNGSRPTLPVLMLGLGTMFFCFAVRDELFRQTWRYSLQGIGLLVLFSFLIHGGGWIKWALDNPVTRYIAAVSYTLYLVHVPILWAIEGLHWPLTVAIAYGLSFAYAHAMMVLVERPLGQIRRGLTSRRREDEPDASERAHW